MTPIPLLFYAPLKSPDDPSPSGDRTMARLLMAALERAGFAPTLASRIRTYDPRGDEGRQRALQAESLQEAEAIAARHAALRPTHRPACWFTYHSYYKAPDHLGPAVARRLGVPYALAETSRAMKRRSGPFAFAHAAAEAAIAAADTIFVVARRDRDALASPAGPRLVDLPPFLDADGWGSGDGLRSARSGGPLRLLTVAMMRPGDKLASYRLLSGALARLGELPWTLEVAGDGPARREVVALFAPFGDRVMFHGCCDGTELQALYRAADLLVWPAVNEAYGMALLEAQACGCPVVAGDYGGVADAMIPGVTALLTPPGDIDAFATAIAVLAADPARRAAMSEAAFRFVTEERSLARAASILSAALRHDLGRTAAA